MKIYSNFVDPKRFELKFDELKDVDFQFFFEYRPTERELALSDINIFACEEPNEYFGNHDWIIQNHEKFSLILTWSEKVLYNCPNAQLLIYGESWLDDGTDRITKQREKKFEVSHLRGAKLNSYGHSLRYSIYNRLNEIKIPTKFYPTVEPYKVWQDNINGKDFILGESMFSVIIENTSHHNYFTEKLTDCMLMKTIPIYWGCSNIGNYYNIDGMRIFQSDDEAIEIINSLTPEEYNSRLPFICRNYENALKYKNYISRIKSDIIKIFQSNGIM
jgi:hypothetical protein